MISLRAALRLGTKRWARIPLRSGADISSEVINIKLPFKVISCYFSSKESDKAYQIKENQVPQNFTFPQEDLKAYQDEVQRRPKKQKENNTSIIDELFADPSQPYSTSFAKSCEYLLTDWCRQVAHLRNQELPDKLKQLMTKKLPEIVNFVLTPSAPSDLRHKCLILLLSEKTDEELVSKILYQTVADVAHLPIKVIADIIQTLSTSFETTLRKDTRTKLVTAVINQRWYEITPKYIVYFMYQLDELFDMKEVSRQLRQRGSNENPSHVQETEISKTANAVMDEKDFEEQKSLSNEDQLGTTVDAEMAPIMSINLESRAISVVNDLKIKDLARIVILLAKWRSRNETLLNAIAHFLCEADLLDFSFIQLNNLLFSFSVLNFHNKEVIKKIVLCLSQMVPTSASLACASLASLSHLRWNDEKLVSKYLSFLDDHMSDLTVKDANSVLMSLSNLYAVPKNETEANFIIKLASMVFSKDISPADKVNCAWCLAIIISLGAELGDSLLQPELVKQFSDAEDYQKQVSLQKLNAINTAFQYEVSGYSGPLLSEDILHPITQPWAGCSDKAMKAEFVNVLRKFVDIDAYTKLGELLQGGIVADAVMCASRSGDVRPLHLCEHESEQVYKLAIQLIPFSGVLSVTQSPTGSYCMAARHLKHLGYVPVQILHSDLKPTKSTLEKINNIRDKIRAAVSDVSPTISSS